MSTATLSAETTQEIGSAINHAKHGHTRAVRALATVNARKRRTSDASQLAGLFEISGGLEELIRTTDAITRSLSRLLAEPMDTAALATLIHSKNAMSAAATLSLSGV